MRSPLSKLFFLSTVVATLLVAALITAPWKFLLGSINISGLTLQEPFLTVATLPGKYHTNHGRHEPLRFAFNKNLGTLEEAEVQLFGSLSGRVDATLSGMGTSTLQVAHEGFQPGETVSVVIPPELTAQDGSNTNEPFQMSFVTEADGGTGTFNAPQRIGEESYIALAAGDVDGDGDVDLVAASDIKNQITIFKNDDGQLSLAENHLVGSGPIDVVLGDFDRDPKGRLDIAVLHQKSHQIRVIFNDGDGTFDNKRTLSADQTLPLGTGATNGRELSVTDFDNDGDLDLIAIFTGGEGDRDGGFSRFINEKGKFTLEKDHSPRIGYANPTSIVSTDLDRDGRIETAIVDSTVFSFLEHEGEEGTTFAGQVGGLSSPETRVKVAQDLDHDGDIDLLFVNSGQKGTSISIAKGNGRLSDFIPLYPGTRVGKNPTAAVAGNIDEDGILEVVVANTDNHSISILDAEENLRYFTRSIIHTSNPPHDVVVADLDGDARLDVITATTQGIEVALNTAAPNKAPSQPIVRIGPNQVSCASEYAGDDGNLATQVVYILQPGDLQQPATGWATFRDLKYQAYTCTAVAVNAAGQGPFSQPSRLTWPDIAGE